MNVAAIASQQVGTSEGASEPTADGRGERDLTSMDGEFGPTTGTPVGGWVDAGTEPVEPEQPALPGADLSRVDVLGSFAVDDGEEPDWQERALCAQTDPEAFFPEKGGSTREAKRICLGCEVRAECLDYALAHDERFGIWGGLSERERRRLRRAI